MTGLRFAAFKFAGEIHGQNVVSVLMLYHVMLYVIQLTPHWAFQRPITSSTTLTFNLN